MNPLFTDKKSVSSVYALPDPPASPRNSSAVAQEGGLTNQERKAVRRVLQGS